MKKGTGCVAATMDTGTADGRDTPIGKKCEGIAMRKMEGKKTVMHRRYLNG